MAMKYLIGIDGGGTNSRLLAVDTKGQVLGRRRGRSTNPESNKHQTVLRRLQELVAGFLQASGCRAEDCLALCVGTAGVDTQASLEAIEALVAQIDLPCPKVVVNDAQIALYANTRGGPGLLLNAGTGSIAYGINGQHQAGRVGGYGYLIGDEASAYWVASEGIRRALHAHDGVGADTMLVSLLQEELNLRSIVDVFDYVHAHNKADIARLSPLVTRAQAAGDQVAANILNEASAYLLQCVQALLTRLQMKPEEHTLYITGGLLLNSPWLLNALKEGLHQRCPGLRIQPMTEEAEWGAVYQAAQRAGIALPTAPSVLSKIMCKFPETLI